jgi:deazaflavin-dependent oxidoreductase (nitroreductase family)
LRATDLEFRATDLELRAKDLELRAKDLEPRLILAAAVFSGPPLASHRWAASRSEPARETRAAPGGDMSDVNDWNTQIIEEFRANGGRVGGGFEGAPMVLVHHRGRRSGREYVNPMMYLADDNDADAIYVFASKAGAPTNPDWYYNLTAAGEGSVERGTESYPVRVREIAGSDRDRIYDEQARRYPGFAEYAEKTAGVRTIPVLELHRAS